MPVHFESWFSGILVQLILIVSCARIAGIVFRRMGQPQVCGEIAAGLILGPSVFGAFFPAFHGFVFNPAATTQINILSQIGLVFAMFLIGLEFDFQHLTGSTRTAFSISSAGIALPFGIGIGLGLWLHSQLDLTVDRRGFALFVATALSITAMPVLGRIMIEFNIHRTRLGALTMAAAAMDDAVGWLLLTAVSAVVKARFSFGQLGFMGCAVVAYLLLMIFVVRPLLLRWMKWTLRRSQGELSLNALAQLMVFVFASAVITNLIGIFSVFGAFVLGGILYDQEDFRAAVKGRLGDFVTVFFLPIFFTCTGLRTDISSMTGGHLWRVLLVVLVAAFLGKFGGCGLAARLRGLTWREAASVGAMMNTRGLMELIVLNAGYDLGIIPSSVFFMLVIMAVVNTYMSAPILRRLIAGTEMQPHFEKSQLMKARFTVVKDLVA